MPDATGGVSHLAAAADQLTIGTTFTHMPILGIPPEVLAKLNAIALKTANESALKEAMAKQNLGYSAADGEAFRKQIAADSALYKQLIKQMGLKTN